MKGLRPRPAPKPNLRPGQSPLSLAPDCHFSHKLPTTARHFSILVSELRQALDLKYTKIPPVTKIPSLSIAVIITNFTPFHSSTQNIRKMARRPARCYRYCKSKFDSFLGICFLGAFRMGGIQKEWRVAFEWRCCSGMRRFAPFCSVCYMAAIIGLRGILGIGYGC